MTVAYTEKTVDGERVLVAETEDDFAQALAIAGDRPIEAPREIARKWGYPDEGENVGTLDDIRPGVPSTGASR